MDGEGTKYGDMSSKHLMTQEHVEVNSTTRIIQRLSHIREKQRVTKRNGKKVGEINMYVKRSLKKTEKVINR